MSTTTKQVISNEAFEPELGGASLRTQGVSTDPRPRPSLRSQTTALGKHLLTRGAWLGVYDFKGLFVPRWRPYAGQKARRRGEMGTVREPPFYGLEDELPIL